MYAPSFGKPETGWQHRLYVIIFEADTRAGRAFDTGLLLAILASVLVVMLDSVDSISSSHRSLLAALEWFFTALFTVEYLLRLASVRRPWRYATSLYGIIDLLAVLPTYVALVLSGAPALMTIRTVRLLRVFRVFKMVQYLEESRLLMRAVVASRRKIAVFTTTVLMLVVILATLMYVIEGPANGFTSIPTSIYWAIVTVTTTGYGDVTPRTPLGQGIASLVMLLGYSILAVPTGIVTAEIAAQAMRPSPPTTRTCTVCLSEGHDADAKFCKNCGASLPAYQHD